MKRLLLLSLTLCLARPGAAEWVHRGHGERFATGDFNGDGTPDIVIADEESGVYHIVYRLPGGDVVSPGRISGVPGFTGMAVGRALDTTRDALLLVSPALNRVQVIDNASTTAPASPQSIALEGIGPVLIGAVADMPDGTSAHADLFIHSAWNGSLPHLTERVNGGSLAPLGVPQGSDALRDINPLRIKNTLDQSLAFVRTDFLGDEHLRILDFGAGGAVIAMDQPMPALGLRFAYGFFNESTTGTFLFWQPGDKEMQTAGINTSDIPPTFIGQQTFTGLPKIRLIQALDHGPGRLLITATDGELYIYDFDGSAAPVLVQTIAPPPGAAQITGALPFPDGSFALLHNSAPGGKTTGVHHMELSGGTYQSVRSLVLPAAPGFRGSNLIVYDSDPFVAPAARRLYSGFVPDWTLEATPSAAQILVARATDGGPGPGLAPAASLLTGFWPVSAQAALTNQMEEDISVVSTDTTLGPVSTDLRISPPGGSFDRAVRIELIATPPGTPVRYRTSADGVWISYTEPFWIAWPVTLQAFTEPVAGFRGPIQTASFAFTRGLHEMDSDGDGIPDFVEILNGLDPTAGPDTDGDGLSDLEELLGSTHPALPDNPGGESPRPYSLEVFDLIVKPRSMNMAAQLTPAAEGVQVRARSLYGAILGQDSLAAVARPKCPACAGEPTAMITGLTADRDPPLLLLSTPANFPLLGDMPENPGGRELLKFLRLPELQSLSVDYTPQGLSLMAEAAAWIAAAETALNDTNRLILYTEMTPVDTLAALFLEHRVFQALKSRGIVANDGSEAITLFPHRPLDAARFAPGSEQLRALRQPGAPGEPVLRVEDTLDLLAAYLASAAPLAADLRGFVNTLYQTSALLANSLPGEFAPPVEVIRGWLYAGTVPERYILHSSLTEAGVADLFTAAKAIFDDLGERPVTTRTLAAGSSGGACSVFLDTSENPVALVDGRGRPFLLPISFGLTDGMSFQVTGYSDVSSACAPETLEVISIRFQAIATQSAQDLDGNLLPDAWERLVFGNTGGPHTRDSDGDGYSDLQEFLDGTDPTDPHSYPGVPPADFSLPEITLDFAGSTVEIAWEWPQAYHSFFTFTLQSTPSLQEPFQNAPSVLHSQGSTLRLNPTTHPVPALQFHRIGISLK